MTTLSGLDGKHYELKITRPLHGTPYTVECLDVIEALGLDFCEGELLKGLWRMAAARSGNGKPGNSRAYDAEKITFYAQRILIRAHDEIGLKCPGPPTNP